MSLIRIKDPTPPPSRLAIAWRKPHLHLRGGFEIGDREDIAECWQFTWSYLSYPLELNMGSKPFSTGTKVKSVSP